MNQAAMRGVLAAAAMMLAGCAGPNQAGGTLVGAGAGAIVGGAIGNSPGSVAVGAVVGGLIGNTIGAGLDARDRRAAMDAEYQALEYGRPGVPVQWHGQKGFGDVTPGTSYQVNDYNCRDYTDTVYINGQPQVARGTACRQPNGSWQPVG